MDGRRLRRIVLETAGSGSPSSPFAPRDVDADEGKTRLDAVVPRGRDSEITRVEIGHQVVSRTPRVVRLAADEGATDEEGVSEEGR